MGTTFYIRDSVLPRDFFLPATEMPPGPVQAGEHGFLFSLAREICCSLEGGRIPGNFVSPEEKRQGPSRSEAQVPGAIWAQHFPG